MQITMKHTSFKVDRNQKNELTKVTSSVFALLQQLATPVKFLKKSKSYIWKMFGSTHSLLYIKLLSHHTTQVKKFNY